ncbi:MAG TPA: DUF3611 family protein [Methylocella sp.]|nr:DUF3611 family protein [Methylocella sp.]
MTFLIAVYFEYSIKQSALARAFLIDLHSSIGFTIGALLIIQFFLRILAGPQINADRLPEPRRSFAHLLPVLIYAVLAAALFSGYLQASFSGMSLQFWGASLPAIPAADQPMADVLGQFWGAPLRIAGAGNLMASAFFAAAHGTAALLLAGLLLAQAAAFALGKFYQPAGEAHMPAAEIRQAQALEVPAGPQEAPHPPESKAALSLAGSLRLFGRVQFWVQLALALICGVLLEFATSGRAFSPSSTRGFGDAIYWGIYGFALLWLAIALAFYYSRAARKLVARPASYLSLGKAGFLSFWFVFAGMLAGLLGVLISFTGLALSISLLIVKTVSQPPGIAITDPSKIVRALDVFVLIVNFDLLMAHVIGVGIALWLGIGVTRARLKYMTVPGA